MEPHLNTILNTSQYHSSGPSDLWQFQLFFYFNLTIEVLIFYLYAEIKYLPVADSVCPLESFAFPLQPFAAPTLPFALSKKQKHRFSKCKMYAPITYCFYINLHCFYNSVPIPSFSFWSCLISTLCIANIALNSLSTELTSCVHVCGWSGVSCSPLF